MTTESSIRRKAARRGFKIWKSRERNYVPHNNNFGEYMLVDAHKNTIVMGDKYDATLEDIESELNLIDWAGGRAAR